MLMYAEQQARDARRINALKEERKNGLRTAIMLPTCMAITGLGTGSSAIESELYDAVAQIHVNLWSIDEAIASDKLSDDCLRQLRALDSWLHGVFAKLHPPPSERKGVWAIGITQFQDAKLKSAFMEAFEWQLTPVQLKRKKKSNEQFATNLISMIQKARYLADTISKRDVRSAGPAGPPECQTQ